MGPFPRVSFRNRWNHGPVNQETLLLRQAHPNFVKDDLVTSQAFVPFPKDDGLLSVHDGDQISARDAYDLYTQRLGLASHSVWAVSVGESDRENVLGRPDPLPGNPAHAAIDFSGLPERAWRKVAKRLKAKALNRGCQYRPR